MAQATPQRLAVGELPPGQVVEDPGGGYDKRLLGAWLTNDTYPVRMYPQDLVGATTTR